MKKTVLLNPKPERWEWGLTALLFLALRFGGLLLFHPFHSALFPIEEYYRGLLGHEILNGLSMPYWQYRPDDFAGGSLVIGILAAGFFKLFGSSAFILKSIPVLISLGALLIWFGILWRECSRKCAWYFSLFFIFAPPAFQCYSMAPIGDHYETIFLSALAVWLFLSIQRNKKEEEGKRGNKREESAAGKRPSSSLKVFLLGVLCGFGIWFAYIFSLSAAVIFILWFRKNRRLLASREIWQFAAGFAAGFSPWIFINIQNGFGGIEINGIPFWSHIQFAPWNLRTFFLRDVLTLFLPPAGRWYPGYLKVQFLYALLLMAPVLSCVLLNLWQKSAGKPQGPLRRISDVSLYFALYAALHAVAVQFTDFEGERYMMPLMPAIFYLWARSIEYLESFSPLVSKTCRALCVFPLLGLGFFSWAAMLSPVHAGFLMRTRGYAYDYLSAIPLCSEFEHCEKLRQKMVKKLSEQDRDEIWISFASRTAGEWVDRGENISSEKMPADGPRFAAAFYYHFGGYVFDRLGSHYIDAADVLWSQWKEETPEFQMGMIGIAAQCGKYSMYDRLNVLSPNNPELPREILSDYFRVVGVQYATYWRKKAVGMKLLYEESQIYLKNRDPEERKNFYRGMGQYLALNVDSMPVPGPKDYTEVRKYFTQGDREAFFEGVGSGYELSLLLFPESYKSWPRHLIDLEREPEVILWILQGRRQIRDLIQAFSVRKMVQEKI